MKSKAFTIFFIGLILLSGCSENYDSNLQPSLDYMFLDLDKSEFVFNTSKEASEEFNVYSEGTGWKFIGAPDWIALSPNFGSHDDLVELKVSENLLADNDRTALFYLKATAVSWDYNVGMSVTQDAADPYFNIDETYLVFSGGFESKTIMIDTNCSWEASCSQEWVSLQPNISENTLTISVESNPSNYYRSGSVSINTNKRLSGTVNIRQSPSEVSSSDATLSFDNEASKYVIEIDSETNWNAVVSDDWIEISPLQGNAGKTQVSIEVAPNNSIYDRNGAVTIKADDNKKLEIRVSQRGIYIRGNDSLSFNSRTSNIKTRIESNTDWEILSHPDWISVSPESGKGDADVEVSVQSNDSENPREGKIVVGKIGIDIEHVITVRQEGQKLSVGESFLEFNAMASERSFMLTSDGPWSSSVNCDWVKVSPETGNGDSTIVVSVEENTTGTERTGTISYNWNDKVSHVNVHQQSKYCNISNDAFTFSSVGGTHTLELKTDDRWTALIDDSPEWITLSESFGEGDATIILTVNDNPSLQTRTAIVTVSPESLPGFKITVIQKPRYLTVSARNILFFGKGGTSELVTVKTDGTYKLSTPDSWIAINEESNNGFRVFVTKNETNSFRTGKIVVALTDLENGSYSIEIPVIQLVEGGTFIVNGYPEDADWNYINKRDISIKIEGFLNDKEWGNNFENQLNFKISEFEEDANWDSLQ